MITRMNEAQRMEGRQRARRMAREVEERALAFLLSLGFTNSDEILKDPRSSLSDIDDWLANQDNEAQDPSQPMYLENTDDLMERNPNYRWRDPHSQERKNELMEGIGCIAALIYQRDVERCGIGWVFCEQPGQHFGKVVLGPGIFANDDGTFTLHYEDPWEVARQSWDEIVGGQLSLFFGFMYPGGFGDGMNRAAQAIAEQNGDWVPPMFYVTGAEYPDEA